MNRIPKYIKSIDDVAKLNGKEVIPSNVSKDVLKRISDWMSSEGSKITDPYVQNQLGYAEEVALTKLTKEELINFLN